MVISGGMLNNAGAGSALSAANAAATFLGGVAVTQNLTGTDLGGLTKRLNGTLMLDTQITTMQSSFSTSGVI